MDEEQHQTTLASLQKTMKGCRLCAAAGHYIEPPAVFSGKASANVMTIGQAPGVTEVAAQRPFNASAGRRLFEWLAQAGFDEKEFRQQQYMTSITKCYPGKNKGSGDRVPTKDEQELCSPYLAQEIELVQPKLIIPIGRLAINLFFDRRLPLTDIIGQELSKEGSSIIPLPHPSGASTWHLKESNKILLRRAIRLLSARREALALL